MRPFREIQASDVTAPLLREEMDSRGYLLIRGLLPQRALVRVLGEITDVLETAGWLLPARDPLERIADLSAAFGDPDPSFKRTYQQVFNLESFHSLLHHAAMKTVMKMLVGDRLLVHPKPIGRLIFPNCESLLVQAHQDFRFMEGDTECYTAWIPMHDCPTELGPLRILEGSHKSGFLNHDASGIPKIPEGEIRGGDWVGGPINAGDVLLFHSLTVHAASPNVSKQLRVSLDCRFQDYERPVNPGVLVFSGESGKSWDATYERWRSDELKFYWNRLPLNLKPSKSEIAWLANTSDSPSKRARYARMLSQLNQLNLPIEV